MLTTLPKIALPTFSVVLPISKKKLNCRPYLVKEDKILMMAAQSKDDNTEVTQAVRNIINACVMEEGFDIINYSSLDSDYLLMNLRARSVNDKVDVQITCNNNNCGNVIDTSISIKDLKVIDDYPNRNNKIMISNDIGVKLKPTSFELLLSDHSKETSVELNIDILYYSIESIFNNEQMWSPKDFTKEEFIEWIENIEPKQFKKMIDYIEELPKLVLEKEVVCSKCGYNHKLKYENSVDFF